VDILDVVFRHRDSEAKQGALREANDRKGLIVGVCATLDEGAGIRVAPNDNAGNGSGNVGVVVQRLVALIISARLWQRRFEPVSLSLWPEHHPVPVAQSGRGA
jgi:hypothetical protein